MFTEIITKGLREWGLPIYPERVEMLYAFHRYLCEQNEHLNLTAITDEQEAASRHMLDSLFLLTVTDFEGKCAIDVGCGAGFPGMPLVIYGGHDILMLDAIQKRIDFIFQAAHKLGIGVKAVHARAEELAREEGMRESFDLALSRAVSRLNILSELCLPFLKEGGLFLPQKALSGDYEAEFLEGERAIDALSGRLKTRHDYAVLHAPFTVLEVEKVGETPEKYPRRFAAITRHPL